MAEPNSSQPQDVAAGASTITVASTDTQDHEVPTVRLKLRKPKTGRKVQWTSGTVDNEHMNKKKSKCCCIYKKPKEFGESSSDEDSDDECDHCKGHMEKKSEKQADSVDLITDEDLIDVPPPHINGGDPSHSQ